MSTLGRAIAIASNVHVDQVDKGGKAYILHPIRVMMGLHTNDVELMIIAILHDAVEDCGDKEAQLGMVKFLTDEGFSPRVMAGLDSVTKREGESYPDFIKRCAKNPDGVDVKMGDIEDNSDVTRLKGLTQKDHDRIQKYHTWYEYLKAVKAAGNNVS